MKTALLFCLDLIGVISSIPLITWGAVAVFGELGHTAGGCFVAAGSIAFTAIAAKF